MKRAGSAGTERLMDRHSFAVFFRGLIHSCYDLDFYREVSRHPFQAAVKALVFLVLLLSFGLSALTTYEVAGTIKRDLPAIKEQLPTITIDKGKVSAPVPQPYYVRLAPEPGHPSAGGPVTLLIIDTTGTITSLKRTDALMLLKASALEVRTSEEDTWTVDLSEFDKASLDAQTVEKIAFTMEVLCFPLCFLLLLIMYGAEKALQVLVLFFIARIVNLRNPTRLAPGGLLNISVYALFPATLLELALNLWKPDIHHLWVILAYSMIALFFGIQGTLHAGKTADAPPGHRPVPL
jgi:hypothetical protein